MLGPNFLSPSFMSFLTSRFYFYVFYLILGIVHDCEYSLLSHQYFPYCNDTEFEINHFNNIESVCDTLLSCFSIQNVFGFCFNILYGAKVIVKNRQFSSLRLQNKLMVHFYCPKYLDIVILVLSLFPKKGLQMKAAGIE